MSEICAEHKVSQSQYYRWRDQFFDGAHRAFVKADRNSRLGKLEKENARLKALVAEFALDAKKWRMVRMRRGPYPKVAERNRWLVKQNRAIKDEHLFWGYRRVWGYLRYTRQLRVGRNRGHRLMAAHNLLVATRAGLRAKRSASHPKPSPVRANQWGAST